MGKGFDTTEDCTAHIPEIKRLGYTFACRYYSHSEWKNLTEAEAVALSRGHIYIVAVWETIGTHASYFNHSRGVQDGEAAYQFAQRMGQPPGTPIYFAVDVDLVCFPGSGVYSYFQGVNAALGMHGQVGPYTGTDHHHAPAQSYDVGVYGSGHVCSVLSIAKLVGYTWLAQSMGWQGSKTYSDWNIKQGHSADVAGMSVDTDVSAEKGGGGFRVLTR